MGVDDTPDVTDSGGLVSASEAARLAGVSGRTVRRWAEDGRVSGERTATGWLIDPDSLPDVTGQAPAGDRPAGRTAPDVTGQVSESVSLIRVADLLPILERLADAEGRAARAEAELGWLRERLAAGQADEVATAPTRPATRRWWRRA